MAFRSLFSVRFTMQLRSQAAAEMRGQRWGGLPAAAREDEQGPPVPCGQSGETWTEHLASWAAFGTNRNLLTKMVALGFHVADKFNGFQTNSV